VNAAIRPGKSRRPCAAGGAQRVAPVQRLSGQTRTCGRKVAAATDTHGKLSATPRSLEAQEEELTSAHRAGARAPRAPRSARRRGTDMERLETRPPSAPGNRVRNHAPSPRRGAPLAGGARQGLLAGQGRGGRARRGLRAELERTEAALAEAQTPRDAAAAETAGRSTARGVPRTALTR
jgi:hypothetical protein